MIPRFCIISIPACPGKVLLFLCYTWPLGIGIHRLYIYSRYSDCPTHWGFHGYKLQSLSFTLVLMLIWTNFHYILYLCRISFLRQFQLVQKFVEQHQEDIDACRQVIWDVAYDFNCYSKFIYIFMILTVPFCTWGLTAIVCMQYKQGLHEIPCSSILWMLWSQILMFYIISYSALGGLDVCYMWSNFRIQILTIGHCDSRSLFWCSIKRHFDNMCIETNTIHWTMALSVLCAYVAVYTSGNWSISKNNTINHSKVGTSYKPRSLKTPSCIYYGEAVSSVKSDEEPNGEIKWSTTFRSLASCHEFSGMSISSIREL